MTVPEFFNGYVNEVDFNETLKKPDKKELFLKTISKTYYLYFKNFDYYHVMIGTDIIRGDSIFAIKVPSGYTSAIDYNSLNELLQAFLNKVGIRIIDAQTKPQVGVIMSGMNINSGLMVVNPKTLKQTWFFGCVDNNSPLVFSIFGIILSKYKSFLKKHNVEIE